MMHALDSVLAAVRYDYDTRTSMMQWAGRHRRNSDSKNFPFSSTGTKEKSQSLCIRVRTSLLFAR